MGFRGLAERDGQSDGQNGGRRRVRGQLKPNFQVPRTHCCVEAILTHLVGLRSDRIVLYRLYSFQVIIYFTISNILNVNIFIKVLATSLSILIVYISRFIQHYPGVYAPKSGLFNIYRWIFIQQLSLRRIK